MKTLYLLFRQVLTKMIFMMVLGVQEEMTRISGLK